LELSGVQFDFHYMPWNSETGTWKVGANETNPTMPCFDRGTNAQSAIDYMKRWTTRTDVGCLENALLTIQEHGTQEQWLEAEKQLERTAKIAKGDPILFSFGIPVAQDRDKNILLRHKRSSDDSREDKFEVKSIAEITIKNRF
jgi:hypothetical protein